MKHRTALLVLGPWLASCGRDPAMWSVPPVAEPTRATAPVAPGTEVVINLFQSGERTSLTIDEAGRLEHPLCGRVQIPPSATTAADVCQAVAGCVGQQIRAPLVQVTLAAEGFATDTAGCEGPIASPPSVPSLEFMGLQKLLRAGPPADEDAALRLCEDAVAREVLLYAYKPGHPDVEALTEPLRVGTETWTAATEPTQTFSTALRERQGAAANAAAEAADKYGPAHPERIALQLAAERWQQLVDAAEEGQSAAASSPSPSAGASAGSAGPHSSGPT